MTITLTDDLQEWVDENASVQDFETSGDYVRDLIEKDRKRAKAIAELQVLIDEGMASGFSPLDPQALLAEGKLRAAELLKKKHAG